MKKPTKSLTVPIFITCALGWSVFVSHAIEESNKDDTKNSSEAIKRMDDIKKNSIAYQVESSYDDIQKEYERLKEEERKRLEELERQRLEKERQAKLEQERLARIERERKLAEAKRIEEAKKAEQIRITQAETRKKQTETREQQTISRGIIENVSSNWMTFRATYYGSDCAGCSGMTATGIDVTNTIYKNGLRIIAVDPSIIPLGSVVEVKTPNESFKAIAGDTGGAIKGYRTDILVQSESRASQIGTHNVQIRILKEPK